MKDQLRVCTLALCLGVVSCTEPNPDVVDGGDVAAGLDLRGDVDLRRTDGGGADLRSDGRCQTKSSALLLKDRGQFVMPLLTWARSRYAVSFYDDHIKASDFQGYFALLDAEGQLDSASLRTVAPGGLAPRLAFSGTEFGMSYLRSSGGKYEVRFARISETGELVPRSDIKVGEAFTSHDITWNPTRREWAVAWNFYTGTATPTAGVQMSRIAESTPLGASPPVTISSGSQIGNFAGTGGTALLWNGARYALIQGPPGGRHPELTEFSAEGSVLRRISIGVAASNDPARAALAFDGSGYGVVWMTSLSGTSEVRFGVVGSDGVYQSRTERVLGTPGRYQGEPVIAWNGQEYFAAWHEQTRSAPAQSTLHGVRLTKTGGMVQPAQQLTASYSMWPQLVWNGCQYSLAYEQLDGKAQGRAAYFSDTLPMP